jgi:hypothetical protein
MAVRVETEQTLQREVVRTQQRPEAWVALLELAVKQMPEDWWD